mmetsp:Transcript_5935/g.14746  ORF Transcript_5935/g.14746 Transcript_5935/m.14746 type:complete len:205 (-) Transcript_5935:1829-2443(-)
MRGPEHQLGKDIRLAAAPAQEHYAPPGCRRFRDYWEGSCKQMAHDHLPPTFAAHQRQHWQSGCSAALRSAARLSPSSKPVRRGPPKPGPGSFSTASMPPAAPRPILAGILLRPNLRCSRRDRAPPPGFSPSRRPAPRRASRSRPFAAAGQTGSTGGTAALSPRGARRTGSLKTRTLARREYPTLARPARPERGPGPERRRRQAR